MTIAEAVSYYSSIGLIAHPLRSPNDETVGKSAGKAPLLPNYNTLKESAPLEKFTAGRNIGVVCGAGSDLTVIDIDYYFRGLWDYIFENCDTSQFVKQSHTEKRWHWLFRYSEILPGKQQVLKQYQELGFDVLTNGSNCVMSPSMHKDGSQYQIQGDIENRPYFPRSAQDRFLEVLQTYAEFLGILNKCRAVWRNLWKAVFTQKGDELYRDPWAAFRGEEGRKRHLGFCSELLANGAEEKHLIFVAWLIFPESYNDAETRKNLKGINPKATWKNETIKADDVLSRFYIKTVADAPKPLDQPDPVEEISLDELKALKTDLNNRRIPNLMEILPPDHFINTVTTWMSGMSDTYYEYQVSSALWLLSALLQGKGHVAMKQGKVFPNLYIMILGQSTKSRKSTAVRKIKNVYECATDNELYNDDPTVEGYLEMLSKNPIQNFVRDEVSGLLAKYHKKYNEGIFDLECNVYDGDSVRKIKAAGKDKDPKEFIIKAPYVTHLYATTPDKFTTTMELTDYLCGYGYRFLYAFPTYSKERMDYEMEGLEDIEAWAKVMSFTRTLFNKYNESLDFKFSMTSEAIKLYNLIGVCLEDAGEKLQNDQIDSAIGRAQDNILKIAMLIEIGRCTPSHEITEESIGIAALMMIDFYLPSFMQIMDRILTDVKVNKIEKAISVIRRMGGSCTRSTLIKNAHFTKKECDEVIEAMVMGGILLERCIIETKTTTYILTTESKTLALHSSELTNMFEEFRRLRTFRTLRSFASTEKNLAKSAKSDKEIKTETVKQTIECGFQLKVPCEIAKLANSAKCANSEAGLTMSPEEAAALALEGGL